MVDGRSGRAAALREGEALRVLFVVDGLSYNGAVSMAVAVGSRLRRAGAYAEIFALYLVEDRRRVPVDASVRVTHGGSGRFRMRWAFPLAAWRLLRAVRRADVVVAASEVGRGLLIAALVAPIVRTPFAAMVHANLTAAVEQWVPRRLRRATYAAHRRAAASICISDALVPPVVAAGVDPSRVHVVPTGVEVDQVRALARAAPEIQPAGVPRVVGFGRLSPEKGFDLLVRAHAAVRSDGVDHELLLIGEGPEREALRRLADELGVAASVRVPGFVENPFPVLAGAAAFVLPSRREGLPLTLMQALTLGVPVIASRCGRGVESALEEGRLGELVELESVPALAEAIRRHLQAPERLRASADEAARGADRFDVARTAVRLVEILRPVARKRADARPVTTVSAGTGD